MIPDRSAYLILFRMITNRRTPEERNRAESYIRNMLSMRCRSCDALSQRMSIENITRTPKQERADIDAVFATVEEFDQQIESVNNQAKVAKERRRNDPQASEQSTILQAQRNALIENKIGILTNKLSPVSRSRLQSFINEHLKQKIKLVLAQSVPAT